MLPTYLSYDAPWPVRKIPLRCTVHYVSYHVESKARHAFTHSLVHSFTHSFIYTFTHSYIQAKPTRGALVVNGGESVPSRPLTAATRVQFLHVVLSCMSSQILLSYSLYNKKEKTFKDKS